MTLKVLSAQRMTRQPSRWTKERERKPRLYVSVEGESWWEDFGNRTSRPWAEYRKVLPEVYRRVGLPKGTKARWSQYAGCSCPCSPGFILDVDWRRTSRREPFDVYVLVTGDESAKRTDPKEAERRQRQLAAQL